MSVAADAVWLTVQDAGAVGAVRRAAVALGDELGLSQPRLADLAIVAAEMASNLYKHTTDGIALVQAVRRRGVGGVEILAIDKGPGMRDISASVVDGQSTVGTLGIGLGAIRRQSSEYDAYSWPGFGTVIAATVWANGAVPPDLGGFAARGIVRPMSGEEVSGDGYGIRASGAGHLQIMLCDGLGHGPLAAAAARAAEAEFREAPEAGPKDLLEHIHRRLGHTRGAVVTVVEVDPEHDRLRFAGVGNVAGSIVDGAQRRMMMAQPGIAGHARPHVREIELPCPPGALVVLHSDGVVDRWSLSDQPGLAERSPVVVAATILRDAGTRRDDAAVLVAKRVT
jgi:anti-sigma regulatory factor (Ser/Thr protein kinase)